MVQAPSRRVAAAAMQTVLFQLCHDHGRNTSIKESQWAYLDRKVGAVKKHKNGGGGG